MGVDNSQTGAKLALRRLFLDRFHAGRRFNVFDCCQGQQAVMWSTLRAEYPCEYWGVDVKPRRGRLRIDSVRVLEQPGWAFDVIDIDTYGSPWKHWEALLPWAGRRARPVTVFLTWGLVRGMGGGNVGGAFLRLADVSFREVELPPSLAAGLAPELLERALGRAYEHGLRPVLAAEAGRGGTARYIGIRLEPAEKSSPPGLPSRNVS